MKPIEYHEVFDDEGLPTTNLNVAGGGVDIGADVRRSARGTLAKALAASCLILTGGSLVISSTRTSAHLLIDDILVNEILMEHPPSTQLFATPVALMRNGIPLEEIYSWRLPTTTETRDEACSCQNPQATPQCCKRVVQRGHKMGHILLSQIFSQFKDDIRLRVLKPKANQYLEDDYVVELPKEDFRHILVMRNIYDSLVSGYQYHRSGRECTLNPEGGDDDVLIDRHINRWDRFVGYKLDPPRDGRSLCQYLADEAEIVGMRAYLHWVFRVHYFDMFGRWALAQELPDVRDRIQTVCYEDLTSRSRDQRVEGMIDFLYGGNENHSHHMPFDPSGLRPAGASYEGGHSTSHEPLVRQHLRDVVAEIDQEYYNGDISWLDSILPC